MMYQKFTLEFKKGSVQIVVRITNKKCWVTWFKCSTEKIGLGTEALKLLNKFGYKPLYASEIIEPAREFWLKKLSEKLIEGYTVCHCQKCKRFIRDNAITY